MEPERSIPYNSSRAVDLAEILYKRELGDLLLSHVLYRKPQCAYMVQRADSLRLYELPTYAGS